MSERVVSVKMPASLVGELKRLTHEHHYIDLSEQVRSIVRQKALKYGTHETQLLTDIERQIKESNQQRKEQLLNDLKHLLEAGK